MLIAMPRLPPSRVTKRYNTTSSCLHNSSTLTRLHSPRDLPLPVQINLNTPPKPLSNMSYEPPEGSVMSTTTRASDLAEIGGLREQIFGEILLCIYYITTH